MIKRITVYLDNEQPEFMDKVCCGFVVAENENGTETVHNNFDSGGYQSIKELVDEVVGIFRVNRSSVMVAM
ncbi:MAG: hypothetical protein KKB30_03895 [Proteobacteria bacterium]|nr:hypothetical protein [Pseudomonadota bacterium]MBU1715660.1 hypothetical protein [Pseudomonadota bacterium]